MGLAESGGARPPARASGVAGPLPGAQIPGIDLVAPTLAIGQVRASTVNVCSSPRPPQASRDCSRERRAASDRVCLVHVGRVVDEKTTVGEAEGARPPSTACCLAVCSRPIRPRRRAHSPVAFAWESCTRVVPSCHPASGRFPPPFGNTVHRAASHSKRGFAVLHLKDVSRARLVLLAALSSSRIAGSSRRGGMPIDRAPLHGQAALHAQDAECAEVRSSQELSSFTRPADCLPAASTCPLTRIKKSKRLLWSIVPGRSLGPIGICLYRTGWHADGS